jgi:hypothetical protein
MYLTDLHSNGMGAKYPQEILIARKKFTAPCKIPHLEKAFSHSGPDLSHMLRSQPVISENCTRRQA